MVYQRKHLWDLWLHPESLLIPPEFIWDHYDGAQDKGLKLTFILVIADQQMLVLFAIPTKLTNSHIEHYGHASINILLYETSSSVYITNMLYNISTQKSNLIK